MSEIVEQARALYPSDRLSWLPPALAAALAGYDTTTVFTPRQGGWAGRGHGQGQGQGAAVAAAPTAPAAAAAGPGAASATTAPLKEDAPRYTPMQAPPRPYQNPAAWPGAAGGPGAGYGPASPMPYQPPYPLRQRGNRKLVPALIGGGVLLVVLILLLTHAFSNANNSNNAGNDAPLGSTSASASSGQQLGASGSAAPTNAATNLAAGFSSEYSNTQFTMPGESCTQDGYSDESFTPSSVLFTQSGPQVSTNGGNADISLNCNDDSGTGVTDIAPDNIEIAQVTGTPSASACYSAVQREPIAGDIRYTDLHGGMEFCLVGGENNDQLVFLKLDGTDGGTFDLAWTATGWALPSDNS
jgi:hypothetical protein